MQATTVGLPYFVLQIVHNAMNKISAHKLIATEIMAMIIFLLFMDSVRSDKQLSIYKAALNICNGIVFTVNIGCKYAFIENILCFTLFILELLSIVIFILLLSPKKNYT